MVTALSISDAAEIRLIFRSHTKQAEIKLQKPHLSSAHTGSHLMRRSK